MSTEELRAKIQSIIKRNPTYASLVTFIGGLLEETLSQKPPAKIEALFDSSKIEAMKYGRPLSPLDTMPFHMGPVGELLQRLLKRAERQGVEAALFEDFRTYLDKPGALAELMAAVMRSDSDWLEEKSHALGLEVDLLAGLLRLALRPTLQAIAQMAQPLMAVESWNQGYCPVCGSEPGLAEFEQERGQRYLHCSWCETAWSYARIACPFCGQADHGKMIYLQAEQETALRVDICLSCRRYIKTIDFRMLAEPPMVSLDDPATLHMDLIAQKWLDGNDSETIAKTAIN